MGIVMLVLGLISAYLAATISGRHAATALDGLTRRADQAAASGIEWARDRAFVGGSCASYAGMTVDITCTALQVNKNRTLYWTFYVVADAHHGSYGTEDFVRRTRRARLVAR